MADARIKRGSAAGQIGFGRAQLAQPAITDRLQNERRFMHWKIRLWDGLAALPDAITAPTGSGRFPKQQHPRRRDLAASRNAECEEFLPVNQDDRRYRRHYLRGFSVLQL